MSDQDCELHARLIRKTDQAVLLTNRKNADDPVTPKDRTFWLPRSILGVTSTLRDPAHLTDYLIFRCSIPQWKVTQDNLDEFVKA